MIEMLLRPIVLGAMKEAATLLKRPDAAANIADILHSIADGISRVDDHDFRGAPRTRAWVSRCGQPVFSKDADYINDLTQWACDLERGEKPAADGRS